jgi:soluble lytic murein transglycosylase-like protein
MLAGSLEPAFSSVSFSHKWDWDFRQSAKAWMPGVDWQILKAQCFQESRLIPTAVSPVGAQGLCQFMPGTWRDVEKQLKFPPEASAFAPDLSIEAAAYYMGKLRRMWSAPRPDKDRHSLALASYNAGAGHLINAQKRCGGPNLYQDIAKCLPDITGHHSKETLTYVERIWRYWKRMKIGGG